MKKNESSKVAWPQGRELVLLEDAVVASPWRPAERAGGSEPFQKEGAWQGGEQDGSGSAKGT